MPYIYGHHSVKEFLALFPEEASALFYTNESKLEGLTDLPEKRHQLSAQDLRREFRLKEFESPQGLILEIKHRLEELLNYDLESLLIHSSKKDRSNLILLPDIKDQHNFGAITRSAVAFESIAGIIFPGRDSVRLSPVTAKVSVGALFSLRYSQFYSLKKTIQTLKDNGYKILAIEKREHSLALNTIDFASLEPYVLIFGAEDSGIPKPIQAEIDQSIFIPQSDAIDSLNMSVAAGIVLYHTK